MTNRLRVGLIVNPVAGLGGSVALKGSDGRAIQQQARDRGAEPKAAERCRTFLDNLMTEQPDAVAQIEWLTRGKALWAPHFAQVSRIRGTRHV